MNMNYSFIGGEKTGWVEIIDKSQSLKPRVRIDGERLQRFLVGHRKAMNHTDYQRNLGAFYLEASQSTR